MAQRLEAKLKEQVYKRQYFGDGQIITISGAIDRLLSAKEGQVKERNLRSLVQLLRTQLRRVISLDTPLQMLSSADISRLVEIRRSEGISNGSIRVMLSGLQSMIRVAKQAGCMVPEIEMPKVTVRPALPSAISVLIVSRRETCASTRETSAQSAQTRLPAMHPHASGRLPRAACPAAFADLQSQGCSPWPAPHGSRPASGDRGG